MKRVVAFTVAAGLGLYPAWAQTLPTPNLGAGTKINGVVVAPSATIDTTNPANIPYTAPGSSLARTVSAKFPDQAVSINDFGVTSTTGGDIAAAMNAAITYLCTTATIHGGKITIPKGYYTLSTAITVPCPVWIEGEGRGINSGANYIGGTLIRTSNLTADVFTVQSRGAVKFSNFAIDSSVTKTAGAAISIQGDATAPLNIQSEITGMYFSTGLYDDVRVVGAYNYSVHDNVFQDYRHIGLWLSGEAGTNPDASTGQAHFVGNSFFALNTSTVALAGMVYNCGGDVEVADNKFLGAQFNVLLRLTRGNTGTFVLTGNSFEESTVNLIRVDRSSGVTAQFANLVIVGNQMSILSTGGAGFQGGVSIVADGIAGTPWIQNVTISNNVMNMGVTAAVPLIGIQAGRGVVVAHNSITNLGNTGAWAFDAGGVATKVLFDQNEVHDTPSGFYNTVGAIAVVHDTVNALTFSQLPTSANGSEIYVSDGLYGSSPLTAASTGAIARRLNGAWRG